MTKIKISIKNRFTGSIIFEYEKDDNTVRDTILEALKNKANLSSADLSSADLRYADLRYANLSSADLRYANLSSANLSSADLRSANLRYADLSSADLSSADLRSADLRSADLRYADLSSADLSSADLRSADLRSANLSSADLRSANLSSANLSSADLSSADLRSADLRSANLSSANLSSANLSSADLRSANLTVIKDDFFAVLVRSLPEIKFLRQNIIEGKINGSTYDGECACLSGTLANGAKKHNGPDEKLVIDNIISCRDSDRPIERLFLGIKKGDTPATSPVSKLVLEWLDEFIWYIYKIKLDEPS